MRISCSICKHVFDPHDPLERSVHDRKCNPHRRQEELKKLVLFETAKQKKFGYTPLVPFQTGLDAHVVHNTSQFSSGSYTAKMTKGISKSNLNGLTLKFSNQREQEDDNNVFNSFHSGVRKRPYEDIESSEYEESMEVSSNIENEDAPDAELMGTNQVDNPVTANFLIDLSSHSNTFFTVFSSTERKYLDLIELMTSLNIPKHAFKKFVAWGRSLEKKDIEHSMSYKKVMDSLAIKFGLMKLYPSVSSLLLPSGNTVQVTKFCFMTNLYSLLSDKNLMKPSNLVFGEA